MRSAELEALFPKLAEADYSITSPKARYYNCIAWAAQDDQRWWEPGLLETQYWPDGAPEECTVEAYAEAFRILGYETCGDGSLETGFEKIALFAGEEGPTHAARQLTEGRWTSKLGMLEDVEHSLEGLSESYYGQVVLFMKRRARHHPSP